MPSDLDAEPFRSLIDHIGKMTRTLAAVDRPVHGRIAIIDAPSNLGLRPPQDGVVPGCYKMPWALRNAGLVAALDAIELGCVVPPRYEPDWQAGNTTRNSRAIAAYSTSLAQKIDEALARGLFPLLVGGDCSILLGAGLALKRRGAHGLLFVDGHSDFRHVGNTGKVEAAAGEDLAISVGLGDANLTDLSGNGANFAPAQVAVLGVRDDDAHLDELRRRSIRFVTSTDLRTDLEGHVERAIDAVAADTQGFWLHVDVDVVDSSEMPAVDSPEPRGISFAALAKIISAARASGRCRGMDIAVYDPDLDPGAIYAPRIVSCLRRAFDG